MNNTSSHSSDSTIQARSRFSLRTEGFIAIVCWISVAASASAIGTNILLMDNFDYTNGLVVNEFAFWNPGNPAAHKSAIWQMDSGSLFAIGGAGWTGVPDNVGPDANSSNGNNSAVFRLTTIRSNFADVAVSFALLHQGLVSTPTTPPAPQDGVHIFLRYQSESNLYYASFNRRENNVVIKKKVPGGPNPSNGGTYYELTSYLPHSVPFNRWQWATASVQNNQDGSVAIKLYSENILLLSALDNGSTGGPPIRAAGKVGIRGDNANLKFENFTITAISPGSPIDLVPSVTNLTVLPLASTSIRLEWQKFADPSPSHFYLAELFSVASTSSFSPIRLTGFVVTGQTLRSQIVNLQPNMTYNVFLRHSTDLFTWSLPSNIGVVQTGN